MANGKISTSRGSEGTLGKKQLEFINNVRTLYQYNILVISVNPELGVIHPLPF